MPRPGSKTVTISNEDGTYYDKCADELRAEFGTNNFSVPDLLRLAVPFYMQRRKAPRPTVPKMRMLSAKQIKEGLEG